jgi:hypothetical protein
MKNEIIVQDKTPVSGEGVAHQHYVDLSLDKNDIADSILYEAQLPIEDAIEYARLKLEIIDDRLFEITKESKEWIKSKLEKKFKKEMPIIKGLFKSEGRFNYSNTHIECVSYYNSVNFLITGPGFSSSLSIAETNHEDYPHWSEIREIDKKRNMLNREIQRLNNSLSRTTTTSKRAKLQMAKQILSQTAQGKALTEAMSIAKIATKVKKETKAKK